MDNSEKPRSVKATHTGFQIIETIKDRNGVRLTELANELDLAKSTVHQQLSTLLQLGYVVRENEEYHIGLKFLDIGEAARSRKQTYNLAKPLVEDLASETAERAQFFAEENGRGIYIHTEQGERAVQTGRRVGKRRYLHSSAGGKAILAHFPEKKVSEIIDKWGLPKETDDTLTDANSLKNNLSKIRDRGYSINKAESIDGLWAIGVPVLSPDESPVGALSISGPKHRVSSEGNREELVELLLGTANELELKIAHQ